VTNQELQSTIMSVVAGGVDEEWPIFRVIREGFVVKETRVRHHLHKLRSTRLWPSEEVYSVLRYTPHMDYRVGQGRYEVI